MTLFAYLSGIYGFHICQVHKEEPNDVTFGKQVQAVQADPVYTDEPFDQYPTVVQKTTVLMEHVHTGGNMSASDHNMIQIQFQAILVDPKTTANNLKNGKDYYITAGVEYADGAYVWVGQAKVTTVMLPQVRWFISQDLRLLIIYVCDRPQEYDSSVSLFLTDEHKTIKKGDSKMFMLEIFLTEPMSDLEVGIMQPLGFNDIFHIGDIHIERGNAFACTAKELIEKRYLRSPSGMSIINATITFAALINRDGRKEEDHKCTVKS